MRVVEIGVREEYWNSGNGHRTRFAALADALLKLGALAKRVERAAFYLTEGGNLCGVDDLSHQLLRPEFREQRPSALRTDTRGVSVTCYPSTLALEMICLGYRVALLAPRNSGEANLAAKLAPLSDEERFRQVDGLGAERCAQVILSALS